MITKVTVTGADDFTNQHDLVKIGKEYPFVEFGILLGDNSYKNGGKTRFPSSQWIDRLYEVSVEENIKLNISGHLCGKWVQDLLVGNMSKVGEVLDNELGFLDRIQINTHGYKHKFNDWFLGPVLREIEERNQQIIFQFDDANTTMIAKAINPKYEYRHLSALFDLSHGAGVLPEEWPVPIPGLSVGYAGGLSIDNVVREIEKIMKITYNQDFWIDAETWLRNDKTNQFDLDKVVKFLDLAKPYVKA